MAEAPKFPRLCIKPFGVHQVLDRFGLAHKIDLSSADAVKTICEEFEKGRGKQLSENALCATCMSCPHSQVLTYVDADHITGEFTIRSKRLCKKVSSDGRARLRHLSPYCPDGFNVQTLKWVDPTSLDQPVGSSWDDPTAAVVKLEPVEAEEPFDPELQNHKTVRELADQRRTRIYDERAKGHMASDREINAYLNAEEQTRKEMFFGHFDGVNAGGSLLVAGASTPAAPVSASTFNEEYLTQPRRPTNIITPNTFGKERQHVTDVPETPDAGTW